MSVMLANFHSILARVAISSVVFGLASCALAGEKSGSTRVQVGVIPYGPDQAPEDVKLELAKAGTQQFLDEIVGELVAPTNSRAFMLQPVHSADAANGVRLNAFDKLAAIRNPSTVPVVASFLSDTTRAMCKQPNVVSYVSFAEMAGNTLSKIVTNPPPTSGLSSQDKVKVWQQWWEQNKGKYP